LIYSKTVQIICLLLIVLAFGCKPNRDLVYFSNLEEEDLNDPKDIENIIVPTIQTDDLLSITINSLTADNNRLFNQGTIRNYGGRNADAAGGNSEIEGYLVDKDGNINFPVIGEIHLAGLTKAAARDTLQAILNRDYIKNPKVNIRFLNFKITLVGAVSRPSTVTIPTEKINIVEAISLAGGLNVLGQRENILIIRENNGQRVLIRVNLNDKDLLYSEDYYLKQNDIVYVEPNKLAAVQASLARQNTQFYLSLGSSVLSLALLIFTFNRRR
jgi:polysaccharide export outer membrane protein